MPRRSARPTRWRSASDQYRDLREEGQKLLPHAIETVETLRTRGLIGANFDQLKVLGNGELKKKLKVSAHRFSKTAREKIEQAGGTVTDLPGKKPVKKNKQASAS